MVSLEQKNSGAGNGDQELATEGILGKILTLTNEGNRGGGKEKKRKNILEKKPIFIFERQLLHCLRAKIDFPPQRIKEKNAIFTSYN